MTVLSHRHEFTVLYWRLGPYGDQDIHIHSCRPWDDEPCDRVLVGDGRECDGDAKTHRRMTFTNRGLRTRA